MNGDKEFFPWPADHVNRIGNLPVDLYSAVCDDNNNNNYCSVYPQLPPVIGAPWGYYCGRRFLLPVDYGSVGVHAICDDNNNNKLKPSVMEVTAGNDEALAAGIALAATMQSFVCTHETSHAGTNMAYRVLNSSTQENVHPTIPRRAGRREVIELR